jgi:NAD(P)-dependent dehydrogenase (short-subunit alcohol dehydrogenase family)
MPTFTTENIPDLTSKVIIVTGSNAGLGLETVRQLGRHGPAHIYIATRSRDKAEAAIQCLQQDNANICPISFLQLDLASFQSIKTAAKEFSSKESRLDILVNNAGIMMTSEGLSEDGYEIQFGTNVMGPALFTQLLLPILRNTTKVNQAPRVVFLSSAAHARAPSDSYIFNELKTAMSHRHTTARYTMSKLANIHYARALSETEIEVQIIPVHPGMVATNLHHASTGFFLKPFLNTAVALFATPIEKGALSQIWAAVSPDAKSGQYYGPVGRTELGSKLSQDRELQEKLYNWIQTEIQQHLETTL